MGRPSKLTDAQWEKIEKRLLAGESVSALAREYGVSKGLLSTKFSERIKNVRNVANQILTVDEALSRMNVSERIATESLVAIQKEISRHTLSAASLNSSTSHRLAGIANMLMLGIDDSKPLSAESYEVLKNVMVALRGSNEASHMGLTLMKLSKDASANDDEPTPVAIQFNTKDCRRDDGNNT